MRMHENSREILHFTLEAREQYYTSLRKGSDKFTAFLGNNHSGISIGDGLKERQGHLRSQGQHLSAQVCSPETVVIGMQKCIGKQIMKFGEH